MRRPSDRRWVFRFNVGRERGRTDRTVPADGIGHAVRCVGLARHVADKFGVDVLLAVKGSEDVRGWLEATGLTFELNPDEKRVYARFRPTCVVCDANDLTVRDFEFYKESAALVVNLAPRSVGCAAADVSFVDVVDPAHSERGRTESNGRVYAGPQFAWVSPGFLDVRRRIESLGGTWDPSHLIVSMGGVDQADLTGTVIRLLAAYPPIPKLQRITVVVGPFYSRLDTLRELVSSLPYAVTVLVDPPDFPDHVATAGTGLFGAGITAYEALCVGVPPINVAVTGFHEARAKMLAEHGCSESLGLTCDLTSAKLGRAVEAMLFDDDRRLHMRQVGMALIDGRSLERIASEIVNQTRRADQRRGSPSGRAPRSFGAATFLIS